MKIRYVNKNDDFKPIAKLIYKTDRFIYPYWFNNNINEGIAVISDLMKQENTSFFYKKCIVAEIENIIVGVLVYFDKKSPLDFKYTNYINKNFNYNYTLTKYFIPLEKSINDGETYVAGLCVDENYLRQGIAHKLMNFFFQQLPKNSTIVLDVLAKNTPALKLYQKVGFEIVESYKGFNGYRKHKQPCFSMIKTT